MTKAAIIIILGLFLGACGGPKRPPVPEPYTLGPVDGTWFEEYQCEQVCDGKVTPLSGTTRFEIAQDGPRLTRTDEGGAVWEGRISGKVATLRTFGVGYEEELEMTFAEDLERFVSEGFFVSVDPNCTGTCTGSGVLVDGTWFEEYQCEQVCDGKVSFLNGTTRFEIVQDGPRLTRTDHGGTVWEGRISGTVATLRTFGVGYEEELEMTFAEDLERFVSEGFFVSVDPNCTGTCTGSGVLIE